MIFRGEEHRKLFEEFCVKMRARDDAAFIAVAYLLALDKTLRDHLEDIFDCKMGCFKEDVLNKSFQDYSSRATTRLAINLWNGYCYEKNEDYFDSKCSDLYTPYHIFDNMYNDYAIYYCQAVMISNQVALSSHLTSDSYGKFFTDLGK